MKTSLTALAVATATLLSFAHFGIQAAEPTAQPALTRAEVQSELLRARAAGELPSSSDVYGPMLAQAMKQASSHARRPSDATQTAAAAPGQTAPESR